MLSQTFCRASRSSRFVATRLSGVSTRSVSERGPACGEGVVLGADPRREDLVDAFVVGAAAGHQRVVVELGVGDHREQRLREVVVDVRVDPEQHVPQAAGGRGRGERLPPRARGLVGLDGVEVEVGEGDVPGLHPGAVLEQALRRSPRRRRASCAGRWRGSTGAGRPSPRAVRASWTSWSSRPSIPGARGLVGLPGPARSPPRSVLDGARPGRPACPCHDLIGRGGAARAAATVWHRDRHDDDRRRRGTSGTWLNPPDRDRCRAAATCS